ncbi:hypothetical protein [Sphingomonas alba]|uniref:DUF1508 domain-containing protein n=1 Tax=Sphingomonas alba TaxID=2908208 RepID=A0ABT0RN83_9SPHN|nr:hypothetical protein [Sphingomonas alba]MCL6684035.1 hypothetical protein [Sphingomonas alba]
MFAEAQAYLHMDEEWMWRFYLMDSQGRVIVISHRAYFTRDEALAALREFQLNLARAETG